MGRLSFKIMGIGLLCFTLLFVLGSLLTVWHFAKPEQRPYGFLVAVTATSFLIVVGLGLVSVKKWAAVAFSIVTSSFAIMLVRQAFRAFIHPLPGHADWLGFLFASLLLVPLITTIRGWGTLG